jgi:hypothetical protein
MKLKTENRCVRVECHRAQTDAVPERGLENPQNPQPREMKRGRSGKPALPRWFVLARRCGRARITRIRRRVRRFRLRVRHYGGRDGGQVRTMGKEQADLCKKRQKSPSPNHKLFGYVRICSLIWKKEGGGDWRWLSENGRSGRSGEDTRLYKRIQGYLKFFY